MESILEEGGQAKSRYRVSNLRISTWGKQLEVFVNGDIVVTRGCPQRRPANVSYINVSTNDTIMVENAQCSSEGELPPSLSWINDGSRDLQEWGHVLLCGEGSKQNVKSPPSIVLTQHEPNQIHIIVEEAGQYPSFLYSFWTMDGTAANAANITGGRVGVKLVFHVAYTVRLAEAMVTGIVNRNVDGGGCFGMHREFNERRKDGPYPFEFDILESSKLFSEEPESGEPVPVDDAEAATFEIISDIKSLTVLVMLALSFVANVLIQRLNPCEMDVYYRYLTKRSSSTVNKVVRILPRHLPS